MDRREFLKGLGRVGGVLAAAAVVPAAVLKAAQDSLEHHDFKFQAGDKVRYQGQEVFIPEIWAKDILAAYKKNLVMSNLLKKPTIGRVIKLR